MLVKNGSPAFARHQKLAARAVAELAADYSVPGVLAHLTRVERRKGDLVLENLV